MPTLLKTKRLIWSAVFALVTLVALLSYFSGKRYLAAVNAVEHTLSVESAIADTLSLLKDAETGQRGYLLTGDEQFLEPYATARRDIPALFTHLKALTQSDSNQTSHLAKVETLMREKYAFMDSTIEARRQGDVDRGLQLVRLGRGKQLMDSMRAEFAEMSKRETQTLQSRKEEARSAELTATWGIGIGSLVTGVLALLSLLTVNRDVQELRQTAEELAKSEQYFRLLTEHTSDLVRLLDAKTGKATYVSPSVERLLGYTVEEFTSLPALSLVHPDDLPAVVAFLRDIKVPVKLTGVDTYRMRRKSGEYRWLENRWVARQNAKGEVVELHTVARDVTERRIADEQLRGQASELLRLSTRDELTGLYNRRGFLRAAGKSFGQAAHDARAAALIFVDLNGMKRVNDELGHDVGDSALCDAASVLNAAHTDGDVIARLGGDEFVVFALDFTASELDALRLRLRQLCDRETEAHDRPYRLSMSAGAAFMPGSATSLEQLLDEADAAMYAQKNARRLAGGISIAPAAPDR